MLHYSPSVRQTMLHYSPLVRQTMLHYSPSVRQTMLYICASVALLRGCSHCRSSSTASFCNKIQSPS